MKVLLWITLIASLGCSTRVRQVRTSIASDKWALVGESQDAEVLRKERWKLALERLRKRRASVKIPPIVKLFPTQSLSQDESFDTVADSADEWMHAYYRGLSLIAEFDFDQAVREFQTFILTEPEHVYADRAHYWIVESHYRGREYGLCLSEANDFLAHFPHSIKRTDVLSLRALALKNMNGPVEWSTKEPG